MNCNLNRIHKDGFCNYTVNEYTKNLLIDLVKYSKEFFNLEMNEKKKYSFENTTSGYRDIGMEYSSIISNPDLNQSFSFRAIDKKLLSSFDEIKNFKSTAYKIQEQLDEVAQKIIADISREFGHKDVIPTNLNSWLQVNFYQPFNKNREFLQDSHEDGHIITLATATRKGLEYKTKNGYVENNIVEIEDFLVMPGELLSLLTGNKIKSLFHRVKCHKDVKERFSIMYFVNPNERHHIPPWIKNDFNKNINIAKKSLENPLQFGLPAL